MLGPAFAWITQRLWPCVLALALGLGALAPVRAQSAEIVALRAERFDDGIYLGVDLKLNLPTPVLDALNKGVPLYFVAEVEFYRDRWYWYDKRVLTVQRTWRVAYQPLSRRWRLNVSSGPVSLNQNFDSLAEALATITRIPRWRIADANDVDPAGRHNVEFRFRLDPSQLPRPFQIGLVGETDWFINVARNTRVNMAVSGESAR